MADRLNGYRILIMETREEAQFSRLLAEQGADVLQCPMFTIHDAPDAAPIEAWIRRFIEKPCDDLVLMTGEGLRRLMKVVRRIDVERDFIAALGKARKFARGPKPGKALREIGLEPQVTTEKPTSEGIVEMLARIDLSGHRVGLQLYPDKDHGRLIGAITAQGAEVDTVLPYVYDAEAADTNIVTAIERDGARPHRRHRADQFGPGPPPDRSRQCAWLRGAVARGAGANADRIGRTCGVGRTQIAWPAHRHRAGQRGLFHEAADIGDGGSARQDRAALGGAALIKSLCARAPCCLRRNIPAIWRRYAASAALV